MLLSDGIKRILENLEAIYRFLGDLLVGDPVAWGFLGFFAVVAALFGLVCVKVRRDLRREDEERQRRRGRRKPA